MVQNIIKMLEIHGLARYLWLISIILAELRRMQFEASPGQIVKET
jgi:hypothetical protein